MDGVKVVLGNRGMTVESERHALRIGKSGEPNSYVTEMSYTRPILLSLCLSDRPPVLCWLSPGEGWDAVT